MAGATTYSCTKCRPIDTEIIEAYLILSNTSKIVSEQEADRVTAEQGRVAAENERERVFGLDHGTATDDHATAVSDHGIAGDDHLLAVADHGTAGDDHTLAEGDHTRAGEDHLASTSATSRANNAAAAAEHMVDLHQGPPGEDGKSPYIGLNGNWYVWDDTTQQYVDSGERAQGRDGNPGSSQAYPFELVNNEETNDSTKAHTAAGAKRLKDEITQLDLKEDNFSKNATPALDAYTKKTSLDVTSYTNLNYSIKTDGTYGTSTTYKHCRVPITPGVAVEVKASSGSMTRFCFVKSTASASSGGAIDLCSGTSCVELSAGTTMSFIAPSDAVAFLFYRGSSPYANTPESINTREAVVPIDNLSTASADAPLSANQGVVLDGKNYDTNHRIDLEGLTASTARDLSVLELQNYYINVETLKWNTSTSYKHKAFPVSEGEKYLVTANNNVLTRYAFLTSNTVSGGNDAPLVSDTSVYSIPAGKGKVVTIPAGCTYFYYYCGLVAGDVEPNSPASIALLNDDSDAFATKTETQYQTSINVASAELLYYYVLSTGKWSANGYHRHIVIPVNAGETYTIVGTTDYTTYLSYLTSKGSVVSGGDVPLVAGTDVRYWINAGTTMKIVVPSGCKYLCFMATTSQDEYNISHRLRCPSSVTKIEEVKDVVSRIVGESGSILSLNPESEWIPKMMSAQKRYYTSSDQDEVTPLVIAHLSDIHGNWDNVARFTEFCDKYTSYINLRLNTGDTVADDYNDGITGYASITNVEKIINIIGNHDSSKYEDGTRDWNYYCGLPCYETFIAPFVDGWGVTQPEDAATNGYCYFYKDFAAKKLRVVFVDIMAYDDTENTWLASVLEDALENEYHIVIATHYAGVRKSSESSEKVFDKVACNYTTLYSLGSNSTNLTPYNYSAYKMMVTVDGFMRSGGKFVGYLQGHYHADFIAKCAEFPSQLIFSIGSSKSGEVRDYKHTVGTRFQDEFQVVAIDTKNTIVKVFKVGANIDRYGRTKGSVCLNYTTGEVLGEGMF